MEHSMVSQKIKNLRGKKGLSQEQLADEAGLSIRTIQPIEKGDTIPRGDTLLRLTGALGVTPDDLFEWDQVEDIGYVKLMNLSSFAVCFQPVLGIIIPLAMWIFKRDKVKKVNSTGVSIINFQITWNLIFYLIFLIGSQGRMLPFSISFFQNFRIFWIGAFRLEVDALVFMVLYCFNIFMIIKNAIRLKKGEQVSYKLAFKFLNY